MSGRIAPLGRPNCCLLSCLFGFLRNCCHRLNRPDWILANGGFFGQHHGITAIQNRIGNICNFGSGRPWRIDHRHQHMGSRDNWFGLCICLSNELLLNLGHASKRRLNTEISPSDHDSIGQTQYLVQIGQCGLGFNFSNDWCLTPARGNRSLGGTHLFSCTDKRQTNIVNTVLHPEA